MHCNIFKCSAIFTVQCWLIFSHTGDVKSQFLNFEDQENTLFVTFSNLALLLLILMKIFILASDILTWPALII